MEPRADDVLINGQPAGSDEVLGGPLPAPSSPVGATPAGDAAATPRQAAILPAPPEDVVARAPITRPVVGSVAPIVPASAGGVAPIVPASAGGTANEAETDPTVIRHDIAETRAEMAGTIGAIENRLSPKRVREQVRARLLARAAAIAAPLGTTAGEVLGQAAELGTVALQTLKQWGAGAPRPLERLGVDRETTGAAVAGASQALGAAGAQAREGYRRAQAAARANPAAARALGIALGLALGTALSLALARRHHVAAPGRSARLPEPPLATDGYLPVETWRVTVRGR